MSEATELQMEVLEAIKAFLRQHAMSPTVRDLAVAVGAKSTNCIFTKLKSLQKKGLIEWVNEGKSRSIWPVGWRDAIRKTLKNKS